MPTAIATSPIPVKSTFSFSSPMEVLSQMKAIEDELSRTAFNFYEQRGYEHGSALEDWINAESSLLKPVAISIDDKDDVLTVRADVPGFTPEQLKVNVDRNMLFVCGKNEHSDKNNKTAAGTDQTTTRKVHCKVALPSNVDSKRATATLDKGVLTLTLPKLNVSTKIEVKGV